MGIVRDVAVSPDGVTVKITPTYSGCPAMEMIRREIVQALAEAGWESVSVETVLSPPWTTDWLTERGREQLRRGGIAPPERLVSLPAAKSSADAAAIRCPHCGSGETTQVSEFGSTACKALYRCNSCREPFDYFKAF